MADRGMIVRWQRRVGRSTVMIALLLTAASLSALGLRHLWLGRVQAAAVTTLELSTLPTQKEVLSDDKGAGLVISEYEGSFDPRTKQLVLEPPTAVRSAPTRDGRTNTRVDPNTVVPFNTGFTRTVINSTFIQTGDLAGNISGEIQLMNKLGVTLYNTRLVFTRFKLCPVSGTCDGADSRPDATTTPGATGFAYYNDGLIPYQGKLNVSRAYGDIPAGGTSNAIWTFNVSTTPARFFFSFVVLADIGVAAESVYPAAVQVNTSAGAGIVIRGRGFTGTPTVNLLNANGDSVATLTSPTVVSATEITATVPANTPLGVYSVRVTQGANSSTILRRLTVTAPPSAQLSGNVGSLSGTGPFLVSSNITISAAVAVPPGTVFYINTGVSVLVASAGNLNANGGVPGVPNGAGVATPTQIVFTAQRSPGAALPAKGAWGGIDATTTSSAVLSLRNVVVEYGGAGNKPNISINGSGRTLRFTDSISRHSGGTGLEATGNNDSLTGFARNRIEYNGQASGTPAMIVSANASLGLFEIPVTTGSEPTPLGTFATDPSYFYTGANIFMGNQLDAIQIPDTANDFTRSGVLVGQGDTPIRIGGNSSNPAIIGAPSPSAPAEVAIGPTALIQLAAGMDLQAGDYGSNRAGCLAANGFAGVNQVSGASLANSKFIIIENLPSGGNFGAIFFARNAMSNCILNFVQLKNAGAVMSGRTNGAVITDGVNVSVKNTQVQGSASGSIIELAGGVLFSNGTTFTGINQLIIDTIAGGLLGDGVVARKATLVVPNLIALDPQGRGLYIIETGTDLPLLRFFNTTRNPVTLSGNIRIQAGAMKLIAGGGNDLSGENIPPRLADLGAVSGLAVSPMTGDLVYYIDRGGNIVRCINVSSSPVTVNGRTISPGNVGTFSSTPDLTYSESLSGLATLADGSVLVSDASPSSSRVYKVPKAGGAPTPFAGNGAAPRQNESAQPFSAAAALSIQLFQPTAAVADAQGNVYISDTGHGRVIKVDTSGNATLVAQFTHGSGMSQVTFPPYNNPPYPTGLALRTSGATTNIYVALGNAQQIVRVQDTATYPALAGRREVSCDYTSNNCGDGEPVSTNPTFYMLSQPAVASIVADANGIFVADQGSALQGRIRYINLSAATVEIGGVNIAGGNIDTVAGTGLLAPYDNGLATSAELASPTAVVVDPANGNLWISDTANGNRLRYVNRSSAPVTLFTGAGQGKTLTVQPGHIVTANYDISAEQTDNVPVVNAGFETPQGLLLTNKGLYVVDTKKGPAIRSLNRDTSVIRFINTTTQPVTFYAGTEHETIIPPGWIRIIAGGAENASITDGPSPFEAVFVGASDIAVAANGDMFVADCGNRRVRRIVAATGAVSTLAGLPVGGAPFAPTGQGTAPTHIYVGLTFDSSGRLLAVDNITNQLLREKTPGSGVNANGFDVLLTGNPLNKPRDLVFDAAGTLYVTNAVEDRSIARNGIHRVVRLTINGNVASGAAIAGTTEGYSGDLGPAISAQLNFTSQQIFIQSGATTTQVTVPSLVGITIGLNGEIIFADPGNHAIRRIR
jgi:hypothetical protein